MSASNLNSEERLLPRVGLRLLWHRAFHFATEQPNWRRNFILGGLWIALLPPIGWLLALGYRKEVAFRIIANQTPFLPDWSAWRKYLLDGMKAAGVILAYFTPFMALFWSFALNDAASAWQHWPEICLFFIGIVFCIPVCMPLLPPLYWVLFPWLHLAGWQMLLLGVVFWGTAFIMPAAFMQVSVFKTFTATFNLKNVFRLIVGNFSLYLEAWVLSVSATAIALLMGPLAPWGIFWSYLVIVFAFNNLLAFSCTSPYREKLSEAQMFRMERATHCAPSALLEDERN